MYDDIIKYSKFFQIWEKFLSCSNFKNSKIESVKNITPIILESCHIAKDLNVGDKNITKDKIMNIFLLIFLNFKTKHL